MGPDITEFKKMLAELKAALHDEDGYRAEAIERKMDTWGDGLIEGYMNLLELYHGEGW